MSAEIRSDEQVILFPTLARLTTDGKYWESEIHGWIFEPEEDSSARRKFVSLLGKIERGKDEAAQLPHFQRRIRLFLVDNERSKVVSVRIANQTFSLDPSQPDGHFGGTVRIPASDAASFAEEGRLKFRVVTAEQDKRLWEGLVHLVPAVGTSVISDIDDTVKVTEVTDLSKALDNTFFRPYRAVDGMSARYRQWAVAGAQLHFVSNSPWQLYPELDAFLREAGFPTATIHLRKFRLQDDGLRAVFVNAEATKLPAIERIVSAYPQRRFVLVGDSGERDPEVYGQIARKFASQILRIYIRDVTGQAATDERYAMAFKDVPATRWRIFTDPAGLELLLKDERGSASDH